MTPISALARDGDAHRLLNEIVVAHAAALARRGKYHDAEELIQPVVATGVARPEVVDLMARIRVQQGRVDEAIALWREAMAKDGANADFRAALDSLARNRHPARRRVTWAIGFALAPVILLTGVSFGVARRAPQAVKVNTPAPPPAQRLALPDPEQFRSQYTTSEIEGDSVKIGFTQPLFQEGVRLTPYGERALADLSGKLRPFGRDMEITIVGKTDSVPVRKAGRYSDNSVLGMFRAVTAYNQIRSHFADLSVPTIITATSQSAGVERRQPQHRTVTVLLKVPAGFGFSRHQSNLTNRSFQ